LIESNAVDPTTSTLTGGEPIEEKNFGNGKVNLALGTWPKKQTLKAGIEALFNLETSLAAM